MGRNTEDLNLGASEASPEFVTGYHVTPKANRASIEKHGLKVMGETRHPDTGRRNIGVFGSTTLAGVKSHSVYGEDVWEFKALKKDVKRDTWSPNDKDAIKVTYDLFPSQVRRVGHVTADGDVHMHPEEDCNGPQ